MRSNFRLKLFLIMIMFAILISFTVASVDYLRMKEFSIKNNQFQVKQTENIVENSLETIDKAYYLFDQETTAKMKTDTHYLLELYKENPSFEDWDFHRLSTYLGVDLFIINSKNVIIHSNVQDDIGLDFSVCCGSLEKILSERRASGDFFADGLDMEQNTGKIKKYSYMATHDKKYLIELGFSLEDGLIFKEFNFLTVMDELVLKYPSINEINILNMGGLPLGNPAERLSKERRVAFQKTRESRQTTEFHGKWKNEPAIYRYVHSVSSFDTGVTKNKVIEIIYNENELEATLNKNKQTFILQLFIVLTITTVIAFIISRWVAKPMYLAFHDSLTGLKNRAAFDEILNELIKERKGTTALLMMDLDNFKLVNDYLGHHKGDYLLQLVAKAIRESVNKENGVFRLGGDEFAVVLPLASKRKAEEVARLIIHALDDSMNEQKELRGLHITTSIGISLAPEHGIDTKTLYKNADIALYKSKEKGKSQYHVFSYDTFD